MQNLIAIFCFHVGRPSVINLKSMMTIKHPRIQSQLGKRDAELFPQIETLGGNDTSGFQ